MHSQRICMRWAVLYCHYRVIAVLQGGKTPMLVKLNSKHFPAKGETPNVIKTLKELAKGNPTLFSTGTLAVLRNMEA